LLRCVYQVLEGDLVMQLQLVLLVITASTGLEASGEAAADEAIIRPDRGETAIRIGLARVAREICLDMTSSGPDNVL
jgi:hypothetical protein